MFDPTHKRLAGMARHAIRMVHMAHEAHGNRHFGGAPCTCYYCRIHRQFYNDSVRPAENDQEVIEAHRLLESINPTA